MIVRGWMQDSQGKSGSDRLEIVEGYRIPECSGLQTSAP